MKILSAIAINFKKLKYRTGKALFLILPITLLVSIAIIISSQTNNIQTALNTYVFDKIKDANTLIQVSYQPTFGDAASGSSNRNRNAFTTQSGYTEADLAKMKLIDNVSAASIDYSIPISNMSTTDLFTDKSVKFNQLLALSEDMSGIYTKEDFSYKEGEPIPIIINPNTFVQTVEDWGGKDSITVDFETIRKSFQSGSSSSSASNTPPADPREALNQLTPIKSSAIEYNKDELMGKTFTIKFGGFTDVADYSTSRSGTTTTYKKLTADEIAADLATRKGAVNKYWNYDKLNEGVTYTFKIVGIIEEQNKLETYVPESFAKAVTEKYIALQIAARNGTTIPTSELNSTYTGLTYDGTELSSAGGMGATFNFGGGNRGPAQGGVRIVQFDSAGNENTDTYAIPGLAIQVDSANTTKVTGLVTDATVFNNSAKRGSTINLKIASLFDRTQVIKDLNSAGYAMQDINNLDVLNQIQNTLNQVSSGVVIGFIVLTASVIILTMSKFVSESRKEIGIFRAVGFTKNNILSIYILQGLIYTGVGYIVGLLLGIGGNYLSSGFVSGWFNNFLAQTINKTVSVTSAIDPSIFNGLNISSIEILTAMLVGITVIVSFFPALTASSISPVEAIKND